MCMGAEQIVYLHVADQALDKGPSTEGENRDGCAHKQSVATPRGVKLSHQKVESSTSVNMLPSRNNSAGDNEVFLHDRLKWLQKEYCK